MTMVLVKDKEVSGVREKMAVTEPEEYLAFCPSCKALQTVWLAGNTLMQTRKFTQQGSQIHHNCGSGRPCRLYFSG